MIRVAVSGTGNMGGTVLRAVEAQEDMEAVGIIAPRREHGEHVAAGGAVYAMHADPAALFAGAHPDVVVDFTNAQFTPRLGSGRAGGGCAAGDRHLRRAGRNAGGAATGLRREADGCGGGAELRDRARWC